MYIANLNASNILSNNSSFTNTDRSVASKMSYWLSFFDFNLQLSDMNLTYAQAVIESFDMSLTVLMSKTGIKHR
jgi:multidrug transporter EmrE-like cation transporter